MKIDELKDSKTIEFFCNYGTFSDRKVEAIVRQISKHDLLINMTPKICLKKIKIVGLHFLTDQPKSST